MIASKIKKLIELKGFTVIEFCQKANIPSSSFYKMIERDDIKLSTLMRFAQALSVHPGDLLDEEYKLKHAPCSADEVPGEQIILKKENELLRELIEEKDKRLRIYESKT